MSVSSGFNLCLLLCVAEKMSKSNDTDDDLVIVSETIRDAKKTEDTISKVIDEVIEKSIIEDKDDSATLTKIQGST